MDVSLKRLEAVSAWVARHEKVLVGAVILALLARFTSRALRDFWFDELFTFYISRLGDFSQMLQAMPADGMPPLYYVLARLCQNLMGPTELATRTPSILAFGIALLGTYVFVRRRCSVVAALFGLITLGTAYITYYAAEGRPYALVLGFTAVTLVSWQAAATDETGDRRLPLAGMALGIAGAIASHHFGLFHVGLPLLVGETVRLVNRRRFDIPMYAAIGVGASVLALTMSLMWQSDHALFEHFRTSPEFRGKPTIPRLRDYIVMADPWIVGIFAFFLVVSWRWRFAVPSPPVPPRIPAHEVAAALALALLMPFMMVVCAIATGFYEFRYAVGTSIGIAILLGFGANYIGHRLPNGSSVVLVGVSLIMASSIAHEARRVHWIVRYAPEFPRSSVLDGAPVDKPIVVADPLTYLPLWRYSAPELRGRLHYLVDLPYVLGQRDPVADLTLVANQAFIPSKVEDYKAFTAEHRAFLLYCEKHGVQDCEFRPTAWIKARLLSEGYSVSVVAQGRSDILFLVVRK